MYRPVESTIVLHRSYPIRVENELILINTLDTLTPCVKIMHMNKTTARIIHEQQAGLSSLLFSSDTDILKQHHADLLTNSTIYQTNYAILDYYSGSVSMNWDSFQAFSLSSTAFTQLYYLEHFKPDLKPYLRVDAVDNIEKYSKLLFPWLKQPIKTLYDSFKGKGIVISSGDEHAKFAFLLIKTLREVLKCSLPIEVMYADVNDLSIDNRALFMQYKDVEVIDLSTLIIANRLNDVGGWWWKSYSLLMTSFSEVILMDADVLFTREPASLFSHPIYTKDGVILFRDRQIMLGKDFDFLRQSFPYASSTIKDSGLWKETTAHEVESGVLVFDKRRPAAFFALLAACNLSRKPMQQLSMRISHGDKGTISFALNLIVRDVLDGI